MNYICTWFCADEKGEESIFPQTGQKSSSKKHQDIYWKCIILFYVTSKRFNKEQEHILYTNVRQLPVVEGLDVQEILSELQVKTVFTDFKFKTPKGYFQMFQNQFYEFSILEHIINNNKNPEDNYLILDSDCIFLKSAQELFNESANNNGFLSFEDDCTTELVIHGLSRRDMKSLYEELLNREIDEIPGYHLGEFFLASVKNINIIFSEFLNLWPQMLRRFEAGLPKFHEEAQTLSYIYYKNGFKASPSRTMMKRIWTNPVFYRNTEPSDLDLCIWHLPSEKTFGLADLYQVLIKTLPDYGAGLSDKDFISLIVKTLGVPYLTFEMKLKYYLLSYYRAFKKRAKKAPIVGGLVYSN